MDLLHGTREAIATKPQPSIASIAVAIFLVYPCCLSVYRLYFSPLAKFPGPKLTAATGWYETYYQLVKDGGGRFTFKIDKWHEQYGPIVRISPHEIHIRDPDFYENIYSTSVQGIDKPNYTKHQFGAPGATFSTIEHELHRQRKTALNPFFSKRRILEQAPSVQCQVNKICHRLTREYAGTGKILVLGDLFSCFTADVVTSYAFDRSYNFLDAPDFISPFTKSIEGFKKFAHYAIQFPLIPQLLASLPDSLLMVLQPGMLAAYQFKRAMRAQIQDILHNRACGKDDRSPGTIFTEIMDAGLPPQQFTLDRLMDEASGVVGAGIETTKWAFVQTCFHIINNPSVLQRLHEELLKAIPNPVAPPSVTELERVPYLMACIEEGEHPQLLPPGSQLVDCPLNLAGIRLSYGGIARSPRISRRKPLQYGSWTIPSGVPVSTSTWVMHHDEQIYPDSFTYKPERWLDDPKGPDGKKHLSRYMTSFGKGTRGCLGIQLAYVEMILAVAALFRQFEFSFFETDRSDVDCYVDQIAPGVHPDSKGVRVLVKSV